MKNVANKVVRDFLTDDLLSRPLSELGFKDPVQAAQAASALFGFGVEAEIRTYVLITETLANFKSDANVADRFRKELAEQRFLSRGEAELGGRSPKLSNLSKIASVANILLMPEIKPYVPAGFRSQYAMAKLYEEIDAATQDERLQKFLSICQKSGGKLTIAILEQERASLEQGGTPPAEAIAGDDIAAQAGNGAIRHFDLLLFTPSQTDIDKAAKDDFAEPPFCMTANAADRAIGILICPANRLTLCHRKFLRNVGFEDVDTVCLLHKPTGPDVSISLVAAVCSRGSALAASPTDWFRGSNFRLFADAVAPGSKIKAHMFAESGTDADGWRCLVGDANWVRG